ncbi:TPA: hypothetical protein ACYZ5L_003994 [Escherichia coli]|nr:hypothetical protein [Salmonella enterica]EKD5436166.1 hypothetical protein [Salmonella enterica subsp. enterica serovar Montevideo]
MNYTALYSTLYRVRNITHTAAKVFAWLFGVQTAILFLLASGAGAALPYTSTPALRFAAALAVLFIAPRLFDAALRRIATAARHRAA